MTDDRIPGKTPAAGGGLSPATLAVWAGEGESLVQGATQVPVVYSAAYGYPDVDEWLDVALGASRATSTAATPTPRCAPSRRRCASSKAPQAATSFATGMAAVSNTLFALLSPGDRVVSVKDTYGGTNKLFLDFLPRLGVEVELCDTSDHEQIEAAIAEGCTPALPRDADQPHAQGHGHRPPGAAGARRRRRRASPTTPSPRPSTRTRWRWAPTWCCTARPSSSAATPTCSAA